MADRIQIRRDKAYVWASVNPMLADGELGYEVETNHCKLGDGFTRWNDLKYTDASKADYTTVLSKNMFNPADCVVGKRLAYRGTTG